MQYSLCDASTDISGLLLQGLTAISREEQIFFNYYTHSSDIDSGISPAVLDRTSLF